MLSEIKYDLECTTEMNHPMKSLRILSLILLLSLLLAALPAFAEGTTAAVNANTYVFKKPSSSSESMKVKKGTKVEVIGVDGQWAMVQKGGATAFIASKYLDLPSRNEDKAEEKDDGLSFKDYAEAVPAEVSANAYAFKKPDTDSASVKLKRGTKLSVLAVSGEWAKVEKDGKTAYMLVKYLQKLSAAEAEEEEKKEESKPSMTLKEMFSSGKYSNEQLCYYYAVKEMGYNTAAAAGLLANIRAESNFRVNANGDSGRSYGICQWFSARKTRLLNWCEGKGYDPATLYAQLEFLHYELETYYPKVDRYMKGVSNSANGAYDAAYYFCYNFEAPADRAGQSTSRGNSAQNTYYPKYAA